MPGQAYAPRRNLNSGWLGLLFPGVILTVLLVTAIRDRQPLALLILLPIAAMFLRAQIQRRRRQPPVVVDAPGITFGDSGDGDGSRLIPWALITGVVLFEIPRTDTTGRGWQSAIGVQLVGHPDGVSVHRSLSGWSLDRAALEQAVTWFGDVKLVDGPRTAVEPTTAQIRAEVRRIAAEAIREAETPDIADWTPTESSTGTPIGPLTDSPTGPATESPTGPLTGSAPAPTGPRKPRIVWYRSARYAPIDPAAYLGRFDLRSNFGWIAVLVVLQVFLWAVVVPTGSVVGVGAAVIFALPLLLIWRSLRSGGAVALAVDRPGVFFGESSSPGDDHDHRLVPWAEISAVLVYDQLVAGDKQDHWTRAVGVRMRGEPTLVRHWRIVSGWRLDRPALEAAVSRFAPKVSVIDGPPQRPPDSSGLIQALFDAAGEIADERRRRER